jgi:hypothetical protein
MVLHSFADFGFDVRGAWHDTCGTPPKRALLKKEEPMPNAVCRQCAAPIVDYSSLVEKRGGMYCCANCYLISRGRLEPGVPGLPACARCASPIVHADAVVVRQWRPFCCYNCAAAVASAARPGRRAAITV